MKAEKEGTGEELPASGRSTAISVFLASICTVSRAQGTVRMLVAGSNYDSAISPYITAPCSEQASSLCFGRTSN